MGKIEEKFAEIQELFQRIYDYNRSRVSYKVDIENCFIKCYHFKDFLQKNSDVVGVLQQYSADVRQYVEDYINNNLCLQICAAICNRIKHGENRNKTRADAKMEDVTVTFRFDFGPGGLILNEGENAIFEIGPKPNCYKDSNPTEHIKHEFVTELQEYTIKDDKGNSYKAIQVLNDCITTWLGFLNYHHLI